MVRGWYTGKGENDRQPLNVGRLSSILGSMPDTPVYTGWTPRAEDVRSAEFWESGADFEGYIKGEPRIKAEEDTLRYTMKDPKTKHEDFKGPGVRKVAEDLEKAGVRVDWQPLNRK